jgi:hypothetical protein
MAADGALEEKLQAYMKVNELYANAIQGYKGSWVSSVVMGGERGSQTAGSGAQELINLLAVKKARELGIDLCLRGQPPVATPTSEIK